MTIKETSAKVTVDRYMGAKSAAEFLEVQRKTVYKYMYSGLLPFFKTRAGSVRFKVQDLIEFTEWRTENGSRRSRKPTE